MQIISSPEIDQDNNRDIEQDKKYIFDHRINFLIQCSHQKHNTCIHRHSHDNKCHYIMNKSIEINKPKKLNENQSQRNIIPYMKNLLPIIKIIKIRSSPQYYVYS